MRRKQILIEGECYHIFTRCLKGLTIFGKPKDCHRFMTLIRCYQNVDFPESFSSYLQDLLLKKRKFSSDLANWKTKEKLVDVISYCIMPNHVHFLLKQKVPNGTSAFMGRILNSYSRYYNLREKRKGPLLEGRFKNVLVESDEQLIHLTRYIHLNPTTANLCRRPEDWKFSSYKEYLNEIVEPWRVCQYQRLLDIEPKSYQKFVNNQIDYQRSLSKIRHLLIDE